MFVLIVELSHCLSFGMSGFESIILETSHHLLLYHRIILRPSLDSGVILEKSHQQDSGCLVFED